MKTSPQMHTLACAVVLALAVLGISNNANAETPLPTTTGVTADQQIAPQDTVFTFTATVTDANGPLEFGIVNFCDEDASAPNALLGTVVLNKANGTATLRTNSFRIGTHNITAKFQGTTDASSSGSAPAISVTGQYRSQTTLQLTAPGLVAQVAGEPLEPLTGSVTFTDTTAGNTLATLGLGTSLLRNAFFQRPDPFLPYYPLAVGDFNNDGKLDFIAPTQIFLGKGDGGFHAPIPASFTDPGQSVIFAIAGDFNGDGNLDMVAYLANGGPSVFKCFLGKGDGTFSAGSSLVLPYGTYLQSLEIGDFNSDGKLDLATFDQSHAYIALGHGDGSFTPLQSVLDIGHPLSTLTVADFNGDGKADLAVAGSPATLVVALGHGNATFGPKQEYQVSESPTVIKAVDLNSDGNIDLVIGNNYNSTLNIFLGHGNGTFTRLANVLHVGATYGITSGDFNGDGKTDLMLSNTNVGTMRLLIGHGDGTFLQSQQMTFDVMSTNLWTADLNGDGEPDVLASVAGGVVLLNQARSMAAASLDGTVLTGLGTHIITATYNGDSSTPGSTSKPLQIPAQ
jgi:Bacterial Ig-like domain (group 3)/FG-GAP-like repeat